MSPGSLAVRGFDLELAPPDLGTITKALAALVPFDRRPVIAAR